MPGPSKLEKRRMNEHLQSHGLGSLDDPTILLQLAVMVRDHDHFRAVLMKVTADKRALCYQALAPKLKFKAKAARRLRDGSEAGGRAHAAPDLRSEHARRD
jgi:hypothetical protein